MVVAPSRERGLKPDGADLNNYTNIVAPSRERGLKHHSILSVLAA